MNRNLLGIFSLATGTPIEWNGFDVAALELPAIAAVEDIANSERVLGPVEVVQAFGVQRLAGVGRDSPVPAFGNQRARGQFGVIIEVIFVELGQHLSHAELV